MKCNTLKLRNVDVKIVNFILKKDDLKEGKEPLPRDRRYWDVFLSIHLVWNHMEQECDGTQSL